MIGQADLRLTLVVFSFSPNERPAKPDLSRRGAEYSGGISPRQQGFLAYFSVICGATGPVSLVGLLRRTILKDADLILLVPLLQLIPMVLLVMLVPLVMLAMLVKSVVLVSLKAPVTLVPIANAENQDFTPLCSAACRCLMCKSSGNLSCPTGLPFPGHSRPFSFILVLR